MTTTEFYRTQERLHEQRDIRGMLNLMAEHYGSLEGEFTESQLVDLDMMLSWAMRLADEELFQRVQARLTERYREQLEREGGPRKLIAPEPEPVKKPRFRWR